MKHWGSTCSILATFSRKQSAFCVPAAGARPRGAELGRHPGLRHLCRVGVGAFQPALGAQLHGFLDFSALIRQVIPYALMASFLPVLSHLLCCRNACAGAELHGAATPVRAGAELCVCRHGRHLQRHRGVWVSDCTVTNTSSHCNPPDEPSQLKEFQKLWLLGRPNLLPVSWSTGTTILATPHRR